MKSLQMVPIAPVALLAAASRRRVFARVGLAVALAVSLLWMGVHGAQADSFNPSFTVSVANPVADTPSDFTVDTHIPDGDVYYSFSITFRPTAWQFTPSDELKLGVPHSTVDASFQAGLMNGPCNTPLTLHWDMLYATTDKSQTVTYKDGFKDSNGDGNLDFIDMYPDFNDRILGPAQPSMRTVGIADLSGTKVLLQIMSYESGATLYGRTLDPALGYPVVSLLNNVGDPQAVPAPAGVTDTCSPFDTTVVSFGTAPDGTVQIKNPKEPGTYTFSVLEVGQRDADGDGIENSLDPCPLTADADWDPRAASAIGPGDADGDGLPSSCDPDDSKADADQDGDTYSNRGDNCPLVDNGVADADNQKDSDRDGIGDACDPHANDADSEGKAPESSMSHDVTITAAAATPSPTVKATPPAATPTTPPAKSPTPTAAVKTATPAVVVPSTGGGGFASDSSRPWWPFAVAGGAGLVALAAGGWYARRRWLG
ncbi:MAG: MSCRAMM family adhesin SdrC [Dehalococcoidia bacterium]|nr:MSCRAMM family adhesin SdrC [Dehalococcoidia bacterium]